MSLFEAKENALGAYLKDRRRKLDPAAFGVSLTRRRTPGLRREEVAQRANVSTTWYTWLEQGRGGAPSADVLDRISRALILTDAEREHLFVLGLGRPPEVRYQAPDGVTPRLQRVLDALDPTPALLKTWTWDIVAWNRAATAVLTDFAELPAGERNVLRLIFRNQDIRCRQPDWETLARTVVSAFRADAARAKAAGAESVEALVKDLCRTSPDFERLWRENDVRGHFGGTKLVQHPVAGLIAMEFSFFLVDARPDLGMIVYNPATLSDADKIMSLLSSAGS
jgi:transcriptional regulator with XRE-family HTH domain